MKGILFTILSISVFASCKKSNNNNCINEQLSWEFQTGKQIDSLKNPDPGFTRSPYLYSLNNGSNTVFIFRKIFADCPEVVDDEGYRDIVFQVPSDVTSFQLNDSVELTNARAWSQQYCYGCDGGHAITSGSIDGYKKSDNTWHINAALPALAPPVNFQADFIKKN
ncbi:MAG: hypothetical protein ACJ749_14740 [Flavisolibacter sp.]